MSSLEGGTKKTAAVCRNCGEMYVVHVSPDGAVTPLGVNECTCGESDLSTVSEEPP